MDVTNAYMYTVKSLPQMFEAIQKAQVPPRFTHDFLRTLGFKSTNDRAFINVLKGLGFLDSDAGTRRRIVTTRTRGMPELDGDGPQNVLHVPRQQS